jgi:poly(hydroxyalkanoate) depolymerase family esterase
MLNAMMQTWNTFAFAPWGGMSTSEAETPSNKTGSRFIEQRLDSDAGSLRYKLFIPSSYNGTPLPLIVMLHGCGQDADDFAGGTGMNELAEEFGVLVAYPEQSSSANSSKCWNWFETGHHQRGYGEPALMAALAHKIFAEYKVDQSRVFAAGLSSGGALAVILGRTSPDIFKAVGCHSGQAHGSARDRYGAMITMRDGPKMDALLRHEAPMSVPVIVFHGDMDSTVHYHNSHGVVSQSIHSYRARHRSRGQVQVEYDEETGRIGGRGFTRHVHRGHGGEVVAEQWTVHGHGHAWSGGNWRGTYTDSNGPDASREMLRFFIGR